MFDIKKILFVILLLILSCNGYKPLDFSKLANRGGIVYYINSDTRFSGNCIKYYPTGEVEMKAKFKDGILIQGSYLAMDGSIYESTEVINDTIIYMEWFSNGQKRWESRTVEGNSIYVSRWHEDGSIRQELFDWEKKVSNDDLWEIPLKYIIKSSLDNVEKQNVLFFMHGNGANLWKYENYLINEFSDNYVTVILQAPYEVSLASDKWTWFDHDISYRDTSFNEEHLNKSLESVLVSIDKINEKEKINPAKIFVGGQSQGGIMACKLALEHPEVIDGFIAHNTLLPNVYQAKANKSEYSTLRGLVINGEYDKTINPINSKQITNTFLELGVNIKSIEFKMGHEFPKVSRDAINDWMVQNN